VTSADLVGLSPMIVVAATAIIMLLMIAFRRHHMTALAVTLAGYVGALATLPATVAVIPRQVTPLLLVDGYGLFYMALLIAAGLVVAVLAYGYLRGREDNVEEFYLLQLLASVGAMVLVMSDHFASIFLGLELLSVALYALIAYPRGADRPVEAGVKYLILAGTSSAFLLFGMALLYAELGTMAFGGMAIALATSDTLTSAVALMGVAMTVTGIGFKLAVVPFHMWTPDVYEGAPAPVTAFVATVSKGAMVALLLRYFVQSGAYPYGSLLLVFSLIAVASMAVGNLLALLQQNIKRILAYSSIAHFGYLLVAFVAGGSRAVEAVTFYWVTYLVTTLGAFGIVIVLSDNEQDAERMEAYRGLFWRQPWLALVFTAALLSLAGIPLTAGFMGKFYVLMAGIEAAQWLLVILLVLNSAIGLFYYLRIVVAVYSSPAALESEQAPMTAPARTWEGGVVLAALMLGLVGLGVYPTPLIHAIRLMVASLL
jgi:NADH-quinone oxidoreductase subunit N